MFKPYLIATNFEHCLQHSRNIDLAKLPTANVIVVFPDDDWILAEVTYPNEVCEIYTYSNDDVKRVNIRSLYQVIQQQAVCWAEF